MNSDKVLAANWKMAVGRAQAKQLIAEIKPLLLDAKSLGSQVWIAPSFPYLAEVKSLLEGTNVRLGAQNACWEPQGAFTGEVSVNMLREFGVDYVIIGHSERRSLFLETDEICARRARGVLEQEMDVVYCIGETLQERESGITESVLRQQLRVLFSEMPAACGARVTIAYEPVWAIGTGLSADAAQIEEAHKLIKTECQKINSDLKPRILYGGSVSPKNWQEILTIDNVAGGLVGGASQKADSLLDLCRTLLA